MGDAAVDTLLGGVHARLEPCGRLLDPVAQLDERVLERGGMLHDVLIARAEHGALGRTQAPQLDGQDEAEDERDQRHHRRPERHESLRGGQVIHVG